MIGKVIASLNTLKEQGWIRTDRALVPLESYPHAEQIIMEKDGQYLRHIYCIHDWGSNVPLPNDQIIWRVVELEPVMLYRAKEKQD